MATRGRKKSESYDKSQSFFLKQGRYNYLTETVRPNVARRSVDVIRTIGDGCGASAVIVAGEIGF